MAAQWAVVLPVKRLDRAKSRLALPPHARADVALALAVDTVTAAAACSAVAQVVVVTDDERAVVALRDLGVLVVPDQPDAGLNPALAYGADVAGEHGARAVAALASDLPALRPRELADALGAAARHPRACVADASGSGTTLLTAYETTLQPHFGVDSFQAHLAAGCADVTAAAGPGLRQDVDSPSDLTRVGVHGAATAAALTRHRLVADGNRCLPPGAPDRSRPAGRL